MTELCTCIFIWLIALYCPAEQRPTALAPQQVEEVVDHLLSSLGDYVFPEVADKLQSQIRTHRSEYRGITDSHALASRLTQDLRAVGRDQHLEVAFGEELGVQKEPTLEQKQHALAFDFANGQAFGAPAVYQEMWAMWIWLISRRMQMLERHLPPHCNLSAAPTPSSWTCVATAVAAAKLQRRF